MQILRFRVFLHQVFQYLLRRLLIAGRQAGLGKRHRYRLGQSGRVALHGTRERCRGFFRVARFLLRDRLDGGEQRIVGIVPEIRADLLKQRDSLARLAHLGQRVAQLGKVAGFAQRRMTRLPDHVAKRLLDARKVAFLFGDPGDGTVARQRVRGNDAGAVEDGHRRVGVAAREMHLAEQVISGHQLRRLGDQCLQGGLAVRALAQLIQRPRQPQARPGKGTHAQHLLVESRGGFGFARLQQGVALDAQGVDQVTILGGNDFIAGVDHPVPVLPVAHPIDSGESFFLVEQAFDAHFQRIGGERLEEVVVGKTLGGRDDTVVAFLAGDHDEQHATADDVAATHEFEELLPVGTAGEVVITQDDIESTALELLQRILDGAAEHDVFTSETTHLAT